MSGELYQPIPWQRGSRQPHLSDGWRAIRSDGNGGFEGIPASTDTQSRTIALDKLHDDAASTIDRLRADLAARDTCIAVLKDERDGLRAEVAQLSAPVADAALVEVARREIVRHPTLTNCSMAEGRAASERCARAVLAAVVPRVTAMERERTAAIRAISEGETDAT